MPLRFILLSLLLVLTGWVYAQNDHPPTCGQKELSQQLYRLHPEFKKKHDALEALLYKQRRQGLVAPQASLVQGGNTVVLPVVVHIIHNGGEENISDDQVRQGIKYLNEAYAASGYYNAPGSTDTHIQFCMAQRDPNGNATSGITRNTSPYTTMGGDSYSADDQHVKNLVRWNPYNYINVWVVKSIPGDVVGYSTLPEAHGSEYEGIVMEAGYFGSTEFNNVVLIHEIGHYLGMYHTFEGGCTNNNCQVDGDMVCDTPPDQSTAYIGCDASMNSCTTDVLSGFNSDQPDLTQDYMDYGNFNCMKVFTPGQSERMNWFIQNELFSLLNCKSCLAPCLSPVVAKFSASASTVPVNTTVNFTNQGVNASHFKWLVDGVVSSTTTEFSKAFSVQGRHIVTLQASGDDVLCDSAVYNDTIIVTCPVKAGFTYPPGIIKAPQTVAFSNTATAASGYVWKVNGVAKATSPSFSYTFGLPGIYLVTQLASGVCTDSASTEISVYDSSGNIPGDICKPVTFQKRYLNNSSIIWDLRTTRDSGYIMGGQYFVPGTDGYGGAMVTKLTKAGGVEWSKYIAPFSDYRIQKVKENIDGTFIACGIAWDITGQVLKYAALVMKLDAKGNVLWVRKFGIAGWDEETALDITETNDGGYAFCGSTRDNDYAHVDWVVAKMDNRGNIAWSKRMNNGFYERAYGIVTSGDTLVVTGIRTLPTGPRSEIVVMKMLASSGNVVRAATFGIDNRSVETTSIFKIPGGYLVGAHSVADGFYYADMDQAILQIDDNLQPVRAAKLNVDVFAGINSGIAPTPDGGFVTARNSYNWSISKDPTWMAIAKVGPDWTLQWIKKYGLAVRTESDDFSPNAVSVTADGGYLVGETTYDTVTKINEHVRIIKTDSKGNTPGCGVDTFQATLVVPAVKYASFTWDTVANVVFNSPVNSSVTSIETKEASLTPTQNCATADCKYLKLNGSKTVCNMQDTFSYTVDRNAACIVSVQWQVDTLKAAIVSYTDTSIRLLFKQAGNVSLRSSIVTACAALQDSLVITVNNNTDKLNLGPDIQLCTSSTVRLSAGSGFKTYQWNTGSVDSTLTAYLPGKYYVTVNDYCGNTFSDTIAISTAPAIKLNLSANAPRCDQDSLTITAAPGFESYSWSPAYNISSVSGNSVKVWPATDTTYTVVAAVNDHCTVTDSTRVSVVKSASISIGNDTSFCAGGSVTLQAPPGFAGYRWQDGSTSTTFTATQKGVYVLAALNGNGCYSKDTMLVADVYALPAINLGRDGAMCLNNTTLHAGGGQNNYVWQNGSADSTFTVTATGTYWVSVTGVHECTNADTIHVTALVAASAGFLPASVSLCENGTVQLSTLDKYRWAAYLWSTGSSEPVITVNQPGLYSLQVTDDNGCAGKDTVTVVVKTDCPKVIYFPNAFTPNGDNNNDFFRPFAGAPLEKFNLQVYNRWGQKIFESSDALTGWDGKYKGAMLNAGSYIYYCRYKFYNEAEGVVKGTVVVVR